LVARLLWEQDVAGSNPVIPIVKIFMKSQRIIGLTGGIASGKSLVANYLQQHHLVISDADIHARDAVKLGSPILQRIYQRYGGEILLSDGSLDRQQLGQIIFGQPPEKLWLEQQIHPFVRQRLEQAISQTAATTVVLVVPLLIEAGMMDLVTEIWLVTCDPEQQIARLTARDGLTPAAAQARINSQMSIAQKIPFADVLLNNASSPESLLKQVDLALNYSIEKLL
jgi:dephospho-CoA kinase